MPFSITRFHRSLSRQKCWKPCFFIWPNQFKFYFRSPRTRS